jgi:hypothetical protein
MGSLHGEGTAKQRLLECESELFISLATLVPEDLSPLREKILKSLNKKNKIKIEDKISMTSFRHTMIHMKNKTASKIISDIYDLYSEVLFRSRFN